MWVIHLIARLLLNFTSHLHPIGPCNYGKCYSCAYRILFRCFYWFYYHNVCLITLISGALFEYQFHLFLTLADKWLYIVFPQSAFYLRKKKKIVGRVSRALSKFCYFPCNILVLHHIYRFFVALSWKLHPAQTCSLFLQSPQTCVSVRMNLACVGLFSTFVAPDWTQITHFFLKDAPAVLYHVAVLAVSKLSLQKRSSVTYFESPPPPRKHQLSFKCLMLIREDLIW